MGGINEINQNNNNIINNQNNEADDARQNITFNNTIRIEAQRKDGQINDDGHYDANIIEHEDE